MSTASQITSNVELEDFHSPAEAAALGVTPAQGQEDLVPADQLPSAANALAELFPPEEYTAPELRKQEALESSTVPNRDFPGTSAALADAGELAAEGGFVAAAADSTVRDGDLQADSARLSGEADGSDGSAATDVAADATAHAVTDAQAVGGLPGAAKQEDFAESKGASQNARQAKNGSRRKKRGLLKFLRAFQDTPKEESASVPAEAARATESSLPAADSDPGNPSAALYAEISPSAPHADEILGPNIEFELTKIEAAASPDRDSIVREGGEPLFQAADEDARESQAAASGVSANEPVVESEDEEVDASDDDHAIASAIERYANLTDPARAVAVQPAHDNAEAPLLREASAGPADLNLILGIPQDAAPAGPVLDYSANSVQVPDIEELPAPSGASIASNDAGQPVSSDMPSNAAQEIVAQESAESAAQAPPPAPPITSRNWSFEEKLASHHEWIESKGASGKRIDFTGADLEGSDLIGVNLRYMDMHDANLRAADLLMADLRDTCLVRANLRDACLVGANLEAANLEGASLETSMGLVAHQLAGANLHDAALPAQILQFEALPEFRRASRTVYGYFVAMMSLGVLSWLVVWMTKDFQLVTNAAIIPFLHSSTAAAALPTVQFYLIAPFALFIVYLVFHFQLQHLWDTVLELPAVFPDGRALGENEPRIVVGLLRAHFRWMNQEAPSTRVIEKTMAIFFAYWIVPATLLFYWLRYLTLQEIHGTILQELLIVGAAGVALHSTTKVGRQAAKWTLDESFIERALGKLRGVNPVTAVIALLGALTFLSVGTVMGVPHGKERAPQFSAGSARRWAPAVLWSFGVDPYADITEAVISARPANWNGSDEQLPQVTGARLNGSNFRYAQAYRAFLANAHLLHAKFQGAFLSQADLRGADLGQSDLRYAILDQAQMSHVNLDRAALDGANLSRSDLRAANLSYASLAGAALVDARLDGATLYGAKLYSATLIRANFEKADLREAHLNEANLEHADMQGAYLWSAKLPGAHLNNALLGTAIFVDADLRGVDLRWAQLPGTVLTGADLSGALLDGADFRGAVGFGANQICSAKSRNGLLLDNAMQAQVTAQCGAAN